MQQINFSNILDAISISEKAEEVNQTPQIYIFQSHHSTFSGFPLKPMQTSPKEIRFSAPSKYSFSFPAH